MDNEADATDNQTQEPGDEPTQDPSEPGGDDAGDDDLSVEDRAKTMGWRPMDEFSGDKSYFVDADEFVRNADEKMPVMRSNMRKMQRDIHNLTESLTLQADMAKETLVAQKNRMESEFDAKLREAVQDGDTETYDLVTAQKTQEMKAFDTPGPKPAASTAFESAFGDFEDRNEWYGANLPATDFANAEGIRVRDANPGISPVDELKKVEAAVKREFTSLGKNPNRNKASAVGNGRRPGKAKGAKTYEAMPIESRDACDNMVSRGISKDAFVKNYYDMQGNG